MWFLQTQRRDTKTLSDWLSHCFYNGRLSRHRWQARRRDVHAACGNDTQSRHVEPSDAANRTTRLVVTTLRRFLSQPSYHCLWIRYPSNISAQVTAVKKTPATGRQSCSSSSALRHSEVTDVGRTAEDYPDAEKLPISLGEYFPDKHGLF